jgi:hypothetical protein
MKRWGLFTFFAVVQAALVAVAVAPALVTFAELPPAGITCASCTSAEAKAALVHAASFGRVQVQQLIWSELWILLGLALLGVAVAFRISLRCHSRNSEV